MKKNAKCKLVIGISSTIFAVILVAISMNIAGPVNIDSYSPENNVISTQDADGIPPHLETNCFVDPTLIYLDGTENPDTATVTLQVSGYGEQIIERVPIDVVFSIDASGSMQSNDPTNLRLTASKNFVDHLNSTLDQAGVVGWDDSITVHQPLSNNFSLVKSQIDLIGVGGMTDIDLGLQDAISILDAGARTGSARIIIFLCDGRDTTDGYTPSGVFGSQADDAASKGYIIYAIGLGNNYNPANLIDMAVATGGSSFQATTAADLIPIFEDIAEQVSNIAGTNIIINELLAYNINYVPGSASITPNSIIGNILTWNVGMLPIGDIWEVSFDIKATIKGIIPVALYPDSAVSYTKYDGSSETLSFPEILIEVITPNSPPEAEAGGPYFSNEGSVVLFDASGSTDVDGDILQYRWDLNCDGVWDTPYSFDPTTTGIWNDDYMGCIAIEVFDGEYAVVDFANITISNVAPSVNIESVVQNQDFNLDEGNIVMLETAIFTGQATDPGIDDLTFTWNWGDGSPETFTTYIAGANPVNVIETQEHAYSEPGVYIITLTVEDDDLGISQDSFSITVMGPRELKELAISQLESLKSENFCMDFKLNKLIESIEKSLYEGFWLDSYHLCPMHGTKVFCLEMMATGYMEHSIAHNNKMISIIEHKINCLEKWGTSSPCLINQVEKMQEINEVYLTAILLLVKADEILARVALNDANNTPISCSKFEHVVDHKLTKAEKELELAMKCVQNGEYTKAISHFKCSWKYSQLAMKFANNECPHCWHHRHCCK